MKSINVFCLITALLLLLAIGFVALSKPVTDLQKEIGQRNGVVTETILAADKK